MPSNERDIPTANHFTVYAHNVLSNPWVSPCSYLGIALQQTFQIMDQAITHIRTLWPAI